MSAQQAVKSSTIAGWGRALIGSPQRVTITIIAAMLLVALLLPFVRWALLDAVWKNPAHCGGGAGACWIVVDHWLGFILFGQYPPDERWRPIVGMAMLAGLGIASSRSAWRGRPLIYGFAIGIPLYYALLAGGVGLKPVSTELWGGLPLTIAIALAALAAAFPLGIVLALGRRSQLPIVRYCSVIYIEGVRGVPLISVLAMASVLAPLFLPPEIRIAKLTRAIIGFTLFEAAYIAEIVRGGLAALPNGQYEAAKALALGRILSLRLIILPQALRLVVPPLVGVFIATLKDTSLVIVIGLYDLLNSAKVAIIDPGARVAYREIYFVTALIYLVICFSLSRLSRQFEIGRGEAKI